MPRGFSDREKHLIRKTLLEKGRELFAVYGLKKTSIAELCKQVGIALGSFYSFYESKEALYFEIMEIEEDIMKKRLFSELLPLESHPRDYLKHLLKRSLEMVEEYPLMNQMYLENSMEIMVRKLSQDKLERHFNKDKDDLLPILNSWRAQGVLKPEKPETITGLLRSLLLMSLHRKEIGEEVYKDTMSLLIDLIADGLILERKHHE